MRFVVVTGMSGSGKATAIKMLEDEGYYCVDNLPVRLIDKFMELVFMPGNEITKVVLGLDVRADQPFAYVEEVLSALRGKGYPYEILFMDARDETLIKRYKESRRAGRGPGWWRGYQCRCGPGSRWRSPESGQCPRQR